MCACRKLYHSMSLVYEFFVLLQVKKDPYHVLALRENFVMGPMKRLLKDCIAWQANVDERYSANKAGANELIGHVANDFKG